MSTGGDLARAGQVPAFTPIGARPWSRATLVGFFALLAACPGTIDTSPGDGGGGSNAAGVGAGVLGDDGLATSCEEVCDPIPRSLDGCRMQCDANCEGCGSSPARLNISEIDHLTLLSFGLGAGSGSGIWPPS